MPHKVINIILQFCAAHFQLFDLLIGGIINFLFDTVNRVVQSVIFVEHLAKVIISAFEPADHVTMFWKFPKDWMMKVHGVLSRYYVACLVLSARSRSRSMP